MLIQVIFSFFFVISSYLLYMRIVGVEPTRALCSHEPESCLSTNSNTSALQQSLLYQCL